MGQDLLHTLKVWLITTMQWCMGIIVAILAVIVFVLYRQKIIAFIKNLLSKMEPYIERPLQQEESTDVENVPTGETTPQSPVTPITEVPDCPPKTLPEPSINRNEENHSEQQTPPPVNTREKKMATDAGEWIVVGASVQGNGHKEMNLPCQDCHAYEYIKDGWGIAITSDGAGSAKLSHIGSAASAARAMQHIRVLIEKEKWIEKNILPSDNDWMKLSYRVLKNIRDELEVLAKKNNCDLKDLSATIIVLVHSPLGIMSAHIGDGRAGYKDMKGAWHSLITPHKGDEANQTIFITSDFWKIPFFEMSGALVPETRIIREQIAAFVVMSDGCESTSWLCNQYDEARGKYFDPNLPYGKFFDSLLDTLQSFRQDSVPLEEREEKWYRFLQRGNKSFVKETDDKTMILGSLYM